MQKYTERRSVCLPWGASHIFEDTVGRLHLEEQFDSAQKCFARTTLRFNIDAVLMAKHRKVFAGSSGDKEIERRDFLRSAVDV